MQNTVTYNYSIILVETYRVFYKYMLIFFYPNEFMQTLVLKKNKYLGILKENYLKYLDYRVTIQISFLKLKLPFYILNA